MRLTPVTVIAGLVLRKRYTRYVFLVTSSPLDCVSTMEAVFSWDRKCNTRYSCEFGSPTDCTDTNRWGCHNCSCGTRACSPHDIARDLGLLQPRVVEIRIDDLNPYNDSRNPLLLLGGFPQHLSYMPLRSPRGLISLYSASFYSGLWSRNVNVLGLTLRNILYLFFKEESHCLELLREFLLILCNCALMSLRVHLCALLVI